MKVPKTPKNFDYDMWIADDGKCMVRIKHTSEVTEVSREVLRVLRAEEQRLRDEIHKEMENGGMLHLELLPDDDTGESWLTDTYDFESELIIEVEKREFCKLLTPKQLSVFNECLMEGKSLTQYASEHSISIPLVSKRINAIRKKAKNFFSEG